MTNKKVIEVPHDEYIDCISKWIKISREERAYIYVVDESGKTVNTLSVPGPSALDRVCALTLARADNPDRCNAMIEMIPGHPYIVSINGKYANVSGVGSSIEDACEDALKLYETEKENGLRE